jgi:thioredoxin 1
MKIFTDKNFEEKIKNGIVVVDFWASWCEPCRMTTSLLESLSKEFPKVVFAKCNIDRNKTTSQKYKIFNIPTVIIFKEGKVEAVIVGLTPKSLYRSKLKELLK